MAVVIDEVVAESGGESLKTPSSPPAVPPATGPLEIARIIAERHQRLARVRAH